MITYEMCGCEKALTATGLPSSVFDSTTIFILVLINEFIYCYHQALAAKAQAPCESLADTLTMPTCANCFVSSRMLFFQGQISEPLMR